MIGHEQHLIGLHAHDLGRLGVGRDMRLERIGLSHRDHAIERDLVVLLRGLEHIGIAVRQHDELVFALQPRERLRHFRKRHQLLDLADEIAHVVHRVVDLRAVHHMGNCAVSDLAIGRVLAMQQRIDHRILEMGPTPPCDEGIRIALPALLCKERCGDFNQAALHVDDGAVLIEHADLHVALDRLKAH